MVSGLDMSPSKWPHNVQGGGAAWSWSLEGKMGGRTQFSKYLPFGFLSWTIFFVRTTFDEKEKGKRWSDQIVVSSETKNSWPNTDGRYEDCSQERERGVEESSLCLGPSSSKKERIWKGQLRKYDWLGPEIHRGTIASSLAEARNK